MSFPIIYIKEMNLLALKDGLLLSLLLAFFFVGGGGGLGNFKKNSCPATPTAEKKNSRARGAMGKKSSNRFVLSRTYIPPKQSCTI